jgi:hypothetical protein
MRRRGSIDVVDAKVAVDLATAQTYSENVFLFIPNLIGAIVQLHSLYYVLIRMLGSQRVHAHHPCWAFASLYELSPQILHSCICDIMFIGRCGWAGRTSSRTDIEIWRSVGHGHRSVCHLFPSVNSSFNSYYALPGVQHRACYAIYRLHTRISQWCSSSLSHLILPAITCTCTGASEPLFLPVQSSLNIIQLTRNWFTESQACDERGQSYPMVLL